MLKKHILAQDFKFVVKLFKRLFVISSLLFICQFPVFGTDSGKLDAFEFVNQDIRDIVYILSLRSGQPIICDDTVNGNGNFMYVSKGGDDDFETAFDAFLYANKLQVIKNENLWTVTKIKVEEELNGKISVKSYDSTLISVFEKISEKTGRSIIYETLPMQRTSINIQSQTVYDAERLMLQPNSDYSVNETSSGVQVSRKRTGSNIPDFSNSDEVVCNISYLNDKYDVQIKNSKISQILEKLFIYSSQSYSDFLVSDERVKAISFTNKTLDETLLLILEQINAEPLFSSGMWYIFPKIEKSSQNSVIQRERSWHIINLKNINTIKTIPFITSKYQGLTVADLSSSQFGIYATEDEYKSIKEYTENLDNGIISSLIQLRYIKTSELLNVLPPSVTKEEITETGTGNSFFYTGSEEKKNQFLEQLKEIDVPKKLVRYDLLILQYEKSSNLSWGMSSAVRPSMIGDRTLISGEIGNLLNVNFDAITAFGLTFSEKINTALAENKAAVFADTTLYGLSGEKLTFKNTNTYRYKDASIDPSTGKEAFSTVTREITSGLVLEIDGWVSGDDVITMQINTSVSKQGVDVSKKNGNPPPTSEKNITTKIRARNGEPVVLSGLSQSDFNESSQGIPLISQIPFLGNLFKSKDVSKTKSEMTIYLLPHIEEKLDEEKARSWKEILDEYLESLGEDKA